MKNLYHNGTDYAMFVVGGRDAAWHLDGQRIAQAANAQEALQLARLDYKIEKIDTYVRNPFSQKVEKVLDKCVMFNATTGKQLGSVGPDFTFLQIHEYFTFIDDLLEANGGSHYDSAGALGNGARIWISVRIPKADFSLGDDKHELYMMFATAFDGTMARVGKLTDVRVVCQNTFQAALRGAGEMFRIKHTKNSNARLLNVKDLMTGVVQDAQELKKKFELLASRKVTRTSLVTVLDKLFPGTGTRRENTLKQVVGIFAANDNGAFAEQAGTAYNLFNAVTAFVDHNRGVRLTDSREGMTIAQARAENSMLDGSGAKLKDAAMVAILEATEQQEKEHVPFEAVISDPLNDATFLKSMGITL